MKKYNILFRLVVFATFVIGAISLYMLIAAAFSMSDNASIYNYPEAVKQTRQGLMLYRICIIMTVIVAVMSLVGVKVSSIVSTIFRNLITICIAILGIKNFEIVSEFYKAFDSLNDSLSLGNIFNMSKFGKYTDDDIAMMVIIWMVTVIMYFILFITSIISLIINAKKGKQTNIYIGPAQGYMPYGQPMPPQVTYGQAQMYGQAGQPVQPQMPYGQAGQPVQPQNQPYAQTQDSQTDNRFGQ